MTTASIGTQGIVQGCKARVAVVAPRGAAGVAALLARGGHELVEVPDWSALADAASVMPFDLVLVDDDGALPSGLDLRCPVMVLGERPASTTVAITPLALEHGIDVMLALALELTRAQTRMRDLAGVVDGLRSGAALVGISPAMRRLHTALGRAADGDAPVLLEGPAGSGKSLASRAIHCKSRRGNRRLIALDGAAMTAESLARGLEEARGTTVVVEDVDRLPAAAQAVLVRHLKERPPGGATATTRLVATTSAHLPELVARGAFREDLFYRLHTLPIVVPALRERLEDLPMLVRAILEAPATSLHRSGTMSPAAIAQLERMSWPGNVTQLEAAVRRAQLTAGGGTIDTEHLVASLPPAGATASSAPTPATPATDDDVVTEASVLPFEQEEQRMLTRALRATKGNVRRAAQLLGIGRATLYRKIQQYHLRLQ